MVHSSKTINRNFLIKASGINSEGKRINTLVGVSGLLALIDEELADKFVTRAIKASFNNDSCCRWELLTEYKYNKETKQIKRKDCWRPLKPGEPIR